MRNAPLTAVLDTNLLLLLLAGETNLIAALRLFIEQNTEHYEQARQLVTRDEFRQLALADTGLLALSVTAVVITTDYLLANRISFKGGHVINFNHLRGPQFLAR